MNQLKNNRCYLAGPMDYAPDHGTGWRERIQIDLADMGLVFLDPCHKPTMKALEDADTYTRLRDAKERGDYNYVRDIMKTIRCVDLRMVDHADFLIVHLDLTVPSFGTIEEITTANRSKKPILIHIEQGKVCVSNWLLGMLPHWFIFSTWPELYDYLRRVDGGIATDPRWIFFNLE